MDIILIQTLHSVGSTVTHFKPTSLVIIGFDQSKQQSFGKISIKTRFDEIEDFVNFFVIDVDSAYNSFLG